MDVLQHDLQPVSIDIQDVCNNPKLMALVSKIIYPMVAKYVERSMENIVPKVFNQAKMLFNEDLKAAVHELIQNTVLPMDNVVKSISNTFASFTNKICEIKKEMASIKKDVDTLSRKLLSLQKQMDQTDVHENRNEINKLDKTKAQKVTADITCHTGVQFASKIAQDKPVNNVKNFMIKGSLRRESRNQCLRVVGLSELSEEQDKDLEDLFSVLLERKFSLHESVLHYWRLGNPVQGHDRTVLVVFKECKTRDQIYFARHKLKVIDNRIFINEDLSKESNKQFKEVRTFAKSVGLTKVWTYRQDIFVKHNGKTLKVASQHELVNLIMCNKID
jgi:archaellum component FlaC